MRQVGCLGLPRPCEYWELHNLLHYRGNDIVEIDGGLAEDCVIGGR